MNSPTHSSLPSGGESTILPSGFNGIVIARPAIVIPDISESTGDEPEGQESVEFGTKGGESEVRISDTHSMDKHLKRTDELFINLSPREKFSVTDSGPSLNAPPRKLPIPNMAVSTHAAIKGILLKPKRILPAQPGGTIKSPRQSAESITPREPVDECRPLGLNPGRINGAESSDSSPQLSVTKLQINVDRLKTYFATPVKGGSNVNSSLGQSANSPLCKENDIKLNADIAEHVRSPALSDNVEEQAGIHFGGGTQNDELKHEVNIQNGSALKHREENQSNGFKTGVEITNWCSKNSLNKMTNNMSAGPSLAKSIDRNIRSPSPKSNTTWDRSSSGYSSDERADPRSPPPTISSASTVCTKVDIIDDDGVSMLHETSDKQGTNCDIIDNLVPVNNTQCDAVKCESSGICETVVIKCDCPIPDVCPHSLGQTQPPNETCETCDNIDTNSVAPDSGKQTTNLPIESQIIPKTVNRRPAWTPGLLNSPASGRIQYRKSGTEPLISLRHPNRQNHGESNFGGLEVCGKSYQQIFTSGKNEQHPVSDTSRNEATSGAQMETLTPLPAFSLPDRSSAVISENLNGGSKLDNNTSEVIRPKVIRQPLSTARHLKDLKTMTLNMNVKLNSPRDDKYIRKSLQDLNSPRRQSPSGKSLPIRARHDQTISQSMNSSFTTIQKPATSGLGKKMWRAPSGLPEHAQMRPFSPFGGTLPPSKLKDNRKQMTE